MLKAAIVYLQGSGGNLLARTLSLSEQTVPYQTKNFADQQPTMRVSAQDRLRLYNNWNSGDWPSTENELRIWYHAGQQDFVNYELTEQWLIDSFHPAMFEYEIKRKILFESVSSWDNIIFIKFEPENLETIKKLAILKRKDLNQNNQIAHIEIPCLDRLIAKYPQALTMSWQDMFNLSTFVVAIQQLAVQLNLDLDYDLVEKLWTTWHTETMKILHE